MDARGLKAYFEDAQDHIEIVVGRGGVGGPHLRQLTYMHLSPSRTINALTHLSPLEIRTLKKMEDLSDCYRAEYTQVGGKSGWLSEDEVEEWEDNE